MFNIRRRWAHIRRHQPQPPEQPFSLGFGPIFKGRPGMKRQRIIDELHITLLKVYRIKKFFINLFREFYRFGLSLG